MLHFSKAAFCLDAFKKCGIGGTFKSPIPGRRGIIAIVDHVNLAQLWSYSAAKCLLLISDVPVEFHRDEEWVSGIERGRNVHDFCEKLNF